ncbi:flagellar assembly peptidoglycan hydrolase FlgJ [Oceanospirillum beijerinckii]|uniref:flagellar assembly peptidoglycan hydrolase FlgJ n=1 Tax=Oceanospirillum beijerinckii TaxID=64976 RepID=UPI000422E64E|nr:flagellar assembly peptidoglycan hydrolase FlgJ [Oceanospirillum beijerinckii]
MISNKYDQSRVFTDVKGLESLRKGAREDDPEALKEVARQFEAMMVQMIMKNARQSNELLSKDGIFDSEQLRFYQQMFDEQMSVNITKGGTFGLADVLVRQLSKDFGMEPVDANGNKKPPATIQDMLDRGSKFPASRYDPELMAQWREKFAAEREKVAADKADAEAVQAVAKQAEIKAAKLEKGFESPEEFIRELYPAAERAAKELGVNPAVMLSQAALETGWGRYMIRDSSGKNSFNLFGIKADRRWEGEHAVVSTLEYRGGVAQRESAAFRAYDSYEDSLKDYASFLQSNPRYTNALRNANDPVAFTKGLQDAGYATDPAYAKKIQRILASPVMAKALSAPSNKG